MLNYKDDSDQKLLEKIQAGDEDAMDCLLEKYRGYVRMEARKFFCCCRIFFLRCCCMFLPPLGLILPHDVLV